MCIAATQILGDYSVGRRALFGEVTPVACCGDTPRTMGEAMPSSPFTRTALMRTRAGAHADLQVRARHRPSKTSSHCKYR